jgi:hypothetical protein
MKDYNDKIKQKREEILRERQNFEKEKESYETMFKENKERLEKEIELLQKFKEIEINKNIKENEEHKLSELKDEYNSKEIKAEIERIKSLYNTKLTQIENKKKILEEEKEKFEKSKNDLNNNFEIKKMEIEQKKTELLKKNAEINERYNILKNKEMYLNDKYEDYQRIKAFVESKEKQNYQYEKDLELAAVRIQDYIKEIIEKEKKIKQKENDLLRIMHLENEQEKKIKNNINDIQQNETELNLRYQFLNTFSYRTPYINNNLDLYNNKNNSSRIPNINNNNYNTLINNNNLGLNTYNVNNAKETNGLGLNNFNIDNNEYNYNNYEKFNAEKYLKSFKERSERQKILYNRDYKPNGGHFDIAKEREYIAKNSRILDRNSKKY